MKEKHKGTVKEVLRIAVAKGSSDPATTDTFKLEYGGVKSDLINVLPEAGACTGSKREKQTITTSTTDTTATGGDHTVSTLTSFTLSYALETTEPILAHDQAAGGCAAQATAIENALEKLSVFHDVTVTDTGGGVAARHSCVWEIEFNTISGDMSLLQVVATHNTQVAGPSDDVSVGDDRIVVAESVQGNIDQIKTRLEAMSTIGKVTVSLDPDNAKSANDECTWLVTFDSNAGTIGAGGAHW